MASIEYMVDDQEYLYMVVDSIVTEGMLIGIYIVQF